MMEKRITGSKNPQFKVLKNGMLYDSEESNPGSFPIGSRFLYQEFPYNSIFTVVEIKIDSSTEYRRIQSVKGDDVFIDVKSLQFSLSQGNLSFINDEQKEPSVKKKSVKRKKK